MGMEVTFCFVWVKGLRVMGATSTYRLATRQATTIIAIVVVVVVRSLAAMEVRWS
jgi:hypothetical protein